MIGLGVSSLHLVARLAVAFDLMFLLRFSRLLTFLAEGLDSTAYISETVPQPFLIHLHRSTLSDFYLLAPPVVSPRVNS